MDKHSFRSYYEAKAARNGKDRPIDWIILPPSRGGLHELRYLGGLEESPKMSESAH